MHPANDVLYCANQDSDSIIAFKVLLQQPQLPAIFIVLDDADDCFVRTMASDALFQVTSDGDLEPLGEPLHIPTPVCIAFQ
jgi:hypothetical protein